VVTNETNLELTNEVLQDASDIAKVDQIGSSSIKVQSLTNDHF